MSLTLPKPGPSYSASDEAQMRATLQREDGNNQKRNQDIVIQHRRLILLADDGSRWSLVVDTSGNLSTVAA